MNEQWQALLEDRGAHIEAGQVCDFGNPEQEIQVTAGGDTFADLSAFGIIDVRGEDAATFLQGQLTNDIRALSPGTSQLSGYCDPKGRLLAILRIFMTAEQQYHLIVTRDILEATQQRLQRYVLMSRVEITDASSRLIGIGLHGPRARELCARLCDPPPEAVGAVCHADGLHCLRIEDAHAPRFVFYAPVETAASVWEELDVRAAPIGAPAWAYLDIVAGIPTIHEATLEAFVPQHVDLDRLGGVSFDKGCYTGQEIVARLHYRGQSKRHLYRLWTAGDVDACHPGTAVLDKPGEDGQAIGTIVDCQAAPDGRTVALASLLDEAASSGQVCLADGRTRFEVVEAVSAAS